MWELAKRTEGADVDDGRKGIEKVGEYRLIPISS